MSKYPSDRRKRVRGPRSAHMNLVYWARVRARKAGLECTITQDDIEIPTHCPYLGIELVSCSPNRCDSSPSLDRIDSGRGYVPGNVEVISWKANRAKSNLTSDELVTFAQNILARQPPPPLEPGQWRSPGGLLLENVHDGSLCVGSRSCVIHNPSGHAQSDFPLLWRNDRGIFERLCPCGIGHPDADQHDYWAATDQLYQAVHGCCGLEGHCS